MQLGSTVPELQELLTIRKLKQLEKVNKKITEAARLILYLLSSRQGQTRVMGRIILHTS